MSFCQACSTGLFSDFLFNHPSELFLTSDFVTDEMLENDNNDIEEKLVKNIVVDITMKDISRFYIMIPQVYQNTSFHLNLVITLSSNRPIK